MIDVSGSRSMRSELDDYIRGYGDSSFEFSESDEVELHQVDHLMNTFKNVVSSFTHRINRQLSHQNHAKSSAQLHDIYSNQMPDIELQSKKHSFVYHLARTYSNRIKNRGRYYKQNSPTASDRSVNMVSEYPAESNTGIDTASKPQLANLMKMNQLGSATIGARMAAGKIRMNGSYTLPRKKKTNVYLENDEELSVPSAEVDYVVTSSYDKSNELSGVVSAVVPVESSASQLLSIDSEETDDAIFSLPSDSDDSSLYYYEQRLAEALDEELEAGSFRDSAVYSDDGFINFPTEQESGVCKLSIRETIQLIEHRLQAKPAQKIEVKLSEKAKCMKDILRSLESQVDDQTMSSHEILNNKILLKSIPDRTRELIECAALTRIRQDSLAVTGDRTIVSDMTTLRKGWVKQVVEILQGDSAPSLTSNNTVNDTNPSYTQGIMREMTYHARNT